MGVPDFLRFSFFETLDKEHDIRGCHVEPECGHRIRYDTSRPTLSVTGIPIAERWQTRLKDCTHGAQLRFHR